MPVAHKDLVNYPGDLEMEAARTLRPRKIIKLFVP